MFEPATAVLAAHLALVAWYTLDLVGMPRLVKRDSLRSIEGLLEAGLLVLLAGYAWRWEYAVFPGFLVACAWSYLQYAGHWRHVVHGASPTQRERYARMFAGMHRFFGESPSRVVPDAYHTVLGGLLVVNMAATAWAIGVVLARQA